MGYAAGVHRQSDCTHRVIGVAWKEQVNMKSVTSKLLLLGFMALNMIPLANGQTQTVSSPKLFPVFDATLYSMKPDFSAYGISPITVVYAQQFGPHWFKQIDLLPSRELVTSVAREAKLKGHPVIVDIEHWPLKGAQDIVQDSLRKYMTVLQWLREAAPDLSPGYYGVPPIRDYWRAIKNQASQEYRSWKDENDKIHSLADAVDIFYPSLYTFYPDQDGWRKYAIAQIEEARRYGNGKPVYVFLWPQYHESNRILGGRYLPEDYWQLELETAKQYADGIVIWGGWDLKSNRPVIWDENAAWWTVTKQFMKSLQPSQPANGTH